MKKLFYIVAFALTLTGLGACGDDTPDDGNKIEEGTGITSKDFGSTISAKSEGVVMNMTFDAMAAWTITSPEKWCTVEPARGAAGKSQVTFSIDPNTESSSRTAKISITVSGHKEETLVTVVQSSKEAEPTTLNEWIHNTMDECYLWNEEYRQVDITKADLESLGFTDFLKKGLEGVDAMDHINIEDGGWIINKEGQTVREYFSNIKQVSGGILSPSQRMVETRADKATGLGFVRLLPTYFNEGTVQRVGIGVLAVYPNSPADKAGFKRGSYINRVNGTTITNQNYTTLVKQLSIASGTVKLGTAIVSVVNGQLSIDEKGPQIDLTAATYDESVLYYAGIITLNDSKQSKVGYLAYGQFDMAYDQALLNIFDQFKKEQVDELILDLRYNGGGHVMTSTMLATLVAGNKYKDQIYTKMEYNKERTDAGKTGQYLIGNSIIPDGNGVYSLIGDALQYSLDMERVYVIGSNDTASASEMIINGLRGLGIEVRLVGQQTHGKNVGMEVWQQKTGSITVEFSPITFRAYNAKNECDYADGFVPDVITATEGEFAVFPFGSEHETVGRQALLWIVSGEKPASVTPSLVMEAPGTGLRLRTGKPIDLSTKPALNGALVFASENE